MKSGADYIVASITRRVDARVRQEIEDKVKGLDCILCERPHDPTDTMPSYLSGADVLKAIRGEL